VVVGVVKEIKPAEQRVALTPAGAHELSERGVRVLVEHEAGAGSGHRDLDYRPAGATVVRGAARIWAQSDLLLKVKEPLPGEYGHLRPGLTLFTYLHLAANPALTGALVRSGTTAIACETVTDAHGGLPPLAPMSEIAGRLATHAGAYVLQSGARSGTQAAGVACGMGARVTVLERSVARIRELERQSDGRATVLMSDPLMLASLLPSADLIIGAVLIPGAAAPELLTREALHAVRPDTVFVDVAVDQGGVAETSRPTTHEDPVYREQGVLHYCVANVPRRGPASARALTNATLPSVLALAGGIDGALADDPWLAAGVNVCGGRIVKDAVALAHQRELAAA
jgi:alanine dehydrogenase